MIRIEIETENAAFGDNPSDSNAEVARILREIAHRLTRGSFTQSIIRDVNGNTVGRVEESP